MASPHITIRPESTVDLDAIRQVHRLAFGGEIEALLVDQLRAGNHTRLSLVAEIAGQIAGHILFSDLQIATAQGDIAALALAPVAVLPERQRQGIGSALIRAGLEQACQTGHRIVIVVGHPTYYPRFGFSAQLAAPLQSKYAGEAFMALELAPGALSGVSGEVRYAPPFEGL
jgi:putative acetyltransferase